MQSRFTLGIIWALSFLSSGVWLPLRSSAQCSNWNVSAHLSSASTCASNGAFNAVLTGPDTSNLTNILYGIPIAANGFSVPLNSSPGFVTTPPGVYQVSVIATCGGSIVGRKTTLTVPGNYQAPLLNVSLTSSRGSFACVPTGRISAAISGGVYPVTFTLLSYPTGFAGPYSHTVNSSGYDFQNLPPGSYTVQAVDACLSGTSAVGYNVASLNPATANYTTYQPGSLGCDTLVLKAPSLAGSSSAWSTYLNDTSFKFSVQVSGGLVSSTPFIRMPDSFAAVRLPFGSSLKDAYGKTASYTIKPPCGSNLTATLLINPPGITNNVIQHCNIDFTDSISLSSFWCGPISYTLRNIATNTVYGPYVTATGTVKTPSLPLGNYTVAFTTGDGYSDSTALSVPPTSGNPYSIAVLPGSDGLNNYADGFEFSTSSTYSLGVKTVELFSGPSGYSDIIQWTGNTTIDLHSQQTPTPTTLKFLPGTYVWKITDDCGVYYMPVNVTAGDLYQFTVGAPAQQLTCQGLSITPTGTATNNGTPKPVSFFLLLNGAPYYVGGLWLAYPSNTPILLTTPGTYTIVATSVGAPVLEYNSTYTFTYTRQPLAVDMSHTQAFLCKGASAGQAQIYIAGKGGIPFMSSPSPHYQYYLAQTGSALSGPYITSNNTGIFTGFSGNANAYYDLKVQDTCGAFAIQPLKVLDLGTASLISSSEYVSCVASNIQLSAIWLPNATYSWTGPNGFTSSLQQPVIVNAGPLNAGVYHVTITTPVCSQVVSDSTILAINQRPPKPLLTYSCMPRPIGISVANASAGLVYQWDIGKFLNGTPNHTGLVPSDTPWTKAVQFPGSFTAVAVDTFLSCSTASDTLIFAGGSKDTLRAKIYSPHLQVCTGDTTILVAQGLPFVAPGTSYQWFRNGTAIPGATSAGYAAYLAGSYRVYIDEGLCYQDTSAPAVVTIISPPSASITASSLHLCAGDTTFLQAPTGTGYSYTWFESGNVLPGVFSSLYVTTQAGTYTVTISNGGCIASSSAATVIVTSPPAGTLSPATPQNICPGASIHFSTLRNPAYTYVWQRNGSTIPGATLDTFNATQGGTYELIVTASPCPSVTSAPTIVNLLPAGVNLGNDTTICTLDTFSLRLSVDPSFPAIFWSTLQATPQIIVNKPGIYWVRATNTCGTFIDTIHVHTLAEYQPTLPADTSICGTPARLQLAVPATLSNIVWSTGATTPAVLIDSPGVYWMEGLSPCGILRDTIDVHFCAPVNQSMSLSKDSLCEGDCIMVSDTASNFPEHYHWIFQGGNPASSDQSSPGVVCYSKAGTYEILYIAENKGGSDTSRSIVTVSAKPISPFRDTTISVRYKANVLLTPCTTAQVADWYLGDSLVCANCPELKINPRYEHLSYRCVVRNGQCADSCSYILNVVDIPHDVWLPDAFTPNGDGRNELFHVITDNPYIEVLELDVYNRWGQRVFNTRLSNEGWDGNFKGKPAPVDTYYWQLQYKLTGSDPTVYSRKGEVLLIR